MPRRPAQLAQVEQLEPAEQVALGKSQSEGVLRFGGAVFVHRLAQRLEGARRNAMFAFETRYLGSNGSDVLLPWVR